MAHASVNATPDERRRVLPGDDFIPASIGNLTHAISIARPPAEVWPWLVQMGAGRAGWYSDDVLDNGRHPSAERVLPELQHLDVGAVRPALPGRTDRFTVLRVDPGRSLVIGMERKQLIGIARRVEQRS